MIDKIIAVCRNCIPSIDAALFSIGYLLTALIVGASSYAKGMYIYIRQADRNKVNDKADALLWRGDDSFELFLNHVRKKLPDKWRKALSYDSECW